MKPVDFTLHRPESLADAVSLVAEYGEDSKVLAGGQSLVPLLNFRLARPDHVIDLGRVTELAQLRRTADAVVLGAMVRQAHAERSHAVAQDVPLLAAALPNVAHPPIRSRGTVGGSLAHGDPAAELPAVARALDATFVVAGPSGTREVAARNFFRSNLITDLAADEILVKVVFTSAPRGTGASFVEVSRRRGDFALVGAGAQITVVESAVRQARICLTGVSSTPHRATDAEELLVGQPLTPEVLAKAADATRAAVAPSGDLHATADYRKDVSGLMLSRAVTEAHRRATSAAQRPQRQIREKQ